jgi:hypothetical protein
MKSVLEPGAAEPVVPHMDGGQPSASAVEGAGTRTSSKSGSRRFTGTSSDRCARFLYAARARPGPGPLRVYSP